MGTKVISGAQGRQGRVFINANELCVTNWELTETVQEEEVTNSCSAGKAQYETGTTDIEGTIEADWDLTVNPHGDPFGIYAGAQARAKLYIHANPGVGSENGPFWEFSEITITSFRIGVPARGKVSYSFTFRNSGTYNRPSGTISAS